MCQADFFIWATATPHKATVKWRGGGGKVLLAAGLSASPTHRRKKPSLRDGNAPTVMAALRERLVADGRRRVSSAGRCASDCVHRAGGMDSFGLRPVGA